MITLLTLLTQAHLRVGIIVHRLSGADDVPSYRGMTYLLESVFKSNLNAFFFFQTAGKAAL